MAGVRIVAGLGNPGARYAETRHNIGFMFVDRLAQAHSASPWREKEGLQSCEVTIGGSAVILVKPQSFMNRSGEPLREVMRFRNIERAELVVAHDEIDLPLGGLRIKQGGGDAGHNGLRSLTACLGGPDYYRLRLGVGRPGPEEAHIEVVDWVLGRFNREERPIIDTLLDRAGEALIELHERGVVSAQNRFNS